MRTITAILLSCLCLGCSADTAGAIGATDGTETDTDTEGSDSDLSSGTGAGPTTSESGSQTTDEPSTAGTGSSTSEGSSTSGSGGSSSSDETGAPVELPEPIAWYVFNGNMHDQIGSADGIEVVGDVNYVPGYDGMAADLHEDSGYFDVSSLADEYADLSNDSRFSVAVRLRPEAYTGTDTLIALGSLGESMDSNALSLQFVNGVIRIFSETGENGADHMSELGPAPKLDEWHGLVFVFDEEYIRTFQDGELLAEVFYTPAETSSNQLTVGNWVDGQDLKLNALLDDLQIFDVVLSDEEASYLSSL